MKCFNSILEIEQHNKAIGHHWFDADSLRYFSSRINDELFGQDADGWRGNVFITSERDGFEHDRRYTVRQITTTGFIRNVGGFQAYSSLSSAKSAARRYVKTPRYLLGDHDEPDGTDFPDLHRPEWLDFPEPEPIDLNITVRALFAAYIACTEYGNDHDLDGYVPQPYDENVIAYGGQDYLVLDDTEADARAEESLQDLWNDCYASTIPDHLEHYIDEKGWIEDAINNDGRGHTLNSYDGNEFEIKATFPTFRGWLVKALSDSESYATNWETLAPHDEKPDVIDLDTLT
ncbi:hypothetical protein LCGC14_2536270, partial [marine sediment metagenome]